MSDVYVEIELENYADRVLADHGDIAPEQIRSEKVKTLTDTGATMLVLPQDLVERLGLSIGPDKVIVTYADERKEQREVAGVAMVHVGDRRMPVNCIVGPPRSEPLLGHIILEELDLLVDANEGKLVPRPESPYLPLLKLK